MKRSVCLLVLLFECLVWGFDYPSARRDDSVVDDYHGIKIADPYRWLEDPYSKETKEFIDSQNALTNPYINSCPAKSDLNARLKEMWDYPKYSTPFKRGSRYFYYKNTGLQNQDVLFMKDSLEGEARVFLDANTLSEDGTISLSTVAFTEDGELAAYTLSDSGSDWVTIHFKDVATGNDYPEILMKVKFETISWTKDNKGIFYGCYPDQEINTGAATETNVNQKIFYHRVNTSQSEDVLVLEFPEEPLWRMGAEVSEDGKFLIVTVVKDLMANLLFYADLTEIPIINGIIPLTPIITKFDAEYQFVTNDGSNCIFLTNKDAPNYRLIRIDLKHPDKDKWTVLLPEHPKNVIDTIAPVDKDKMIVEYIEDVKSVLQLRSLLSGKLIFTFPIESGSIVGISGKRDQSEIFYKFSSFLTPGVIFRCDLTKPTITPEIFLTVEIPGFNASLFKVEQIFYSSKDGTKIPMYIVFKKDLKLDGKNPALMYGYGGFNINLQPGFSVSRIVFLQHLNGVLALPNIRGGGEYGQRWYDAGRLMNKQNVFVDFQAAAEYLIAEGYTNSKLLTIQGGSNGGLLVAACINQRPELFGAAVAEVGVMDMLRFHKFTIGYSWASDYGTSDNEEQFLNLLKYSPLHNIEGPSADGRAQYPATFVLTADHDDRVVPSHSLKYIATLQHKNAGNPLQKNPLLARIDTNSGHGSGKSTAKEIEEKADIMCFMMLSLNLKYAE